MDLDSLDDDDAEQLAARIGPHLDPGSYGDRVVLTRRQLMGVATGTLGTGALLSVGVDEAAAQAAGSQGTASAPNNMFAYDLNVANAVTSALPMNGNDIEDAGSVSTSQLLFDGDASRSHRLAERITSDIDDAGVSITGLSVGEVVLDFEDVFDGTLLLRVNGVNSADYDVLSIDGTGSFSSNTSDSAEVFSGFSVSGTLTIKLARAGRIGFIPSLANNAGSSSDTRMAEGVLNASDQGEISSIDLFAPSGKSVSVFGAVEVYEKL